MRWLLFIVESILFIFAACLQFDDNQAGTLLGMAALAVIMIDLAVRFSWLRLFSRVVMIAAAWIIAITYTDCTGKDFVKDGGELLNPKGGFSVTERKKQEIDERTKKRQQKEALSVKDSVSPEVEDKVNQFFN